VPECDALRTFDDEDDYAYDDGSSQSSSCYDDVAMALGGGRIAG
jgi:hypothetical protein